MPGAIVDPKAREAEIAVRADQPETWAPLLNDRALVEVRGAAGGQLVSFPTLGKLKSGDESRMIRVMQGSLATMRRRMSGVQPVDLQQLSEWSELAVRVQAYEIMVARAIAHNYATVEQGTALPGSLDAAYVETYNGASAIDGKEVKVVFIIPYVSDATLKDLWVKWMDVRGALAMEQCARFNGKSASERADFFAAVHSLREEADQAGRSGNARLYALASTRLAEFVTSIGSDIQLNEADHTIRPKL